MTAFSDPYFYGGYWPWGGVPNAIPVPAPANAAARPDLDKPLVRKETFGGGTGTRQTPYSKAPPGTYHTYGLMGRNPTIAKAYGIVMHAILAGTWNVKIRTEAGEARTYKPSLIGQVGDGVISSPEDAWAETLLQTFDPLRSYLLAGAGRGLFNGHSPFHTEWARRNGATVVGKLRRWTDADLIAGRVQMLKDDQTGDFAGVRFEGNDYDPRYAVNFVNQPEVDPIIGHSNCENCRDEWWEKLQAKDRGRNLDQRATSTVPIVKGPATADGEAKAKDIAAALACDEGVYMPQYLFDTADMSPQHPDAAKFTAFDIDTVDLGNTAPAQAAILDKLRYLDAELLAGFYLAPLQAAESIHGTRAQAGVHADANILYSELVYRGIIEQFNHSLVRLMTLTNRGPAEAERYYFEAGALSDPKQEYLQKLVLALAATPGDPITGPIDRPKLLADTGAPVDVNYKPQPALPTGPTPPEGGPGGGGNGQQQPGANGNGNPERMRQLGLSAGGRWGEDADGLFGDGGDYALSLNCGTGAGGFAPGNTCSKGGRQYVVSRVTRAGMVMGRGADESPDVPPVELGHASEFTPAETPLSQAPLPEFAAKVQAMADGLPEGFGGNKILVSHAFEAARAADPSLTEGAFKSKLRQARSAGLIEMSRIDLTSRFHPDDITASTVNLTPGKVADAPDDVGDTTVEMIVVPVRPRREVRGPK